ncbi:MAG: SDR family oxidoreductase [Eubacterium sp.]|nr:SDR family oxidoreductase [Eubacterium sp.]
MGLNKFKNLYGKNVFITGVSSGIGRATAIAFVRAGCNVIGVSRNCKEESRTLANGGSLRTLKMDVTDDESVDRVMNEVENIDIAVLCAGMGIAGPAESTPIEAVKKQMDVNYFGVLRVGNKVLSGMREKKNGLFIVVGSLAGLVSIPMQSHYSSSKYALEAYVDALRLEMKEYGVKASIVEPGDTRTKFTDNREIYLDEASPYFTKGKSSIEIMKNDERNGVSSDDVARTILSLAGKKNPPARVQVGISGLGIAVVLKLAPSRVREMLMEKRYMS